MRTTVRIDDDLLAELKKRAAGQSLTRVLNEALRRGITVEDDERRQKVREFKQRTYDLGEPLIDVNKALSCLDDLEDQERFRKIEQQYRDRAGR